MKLSTRIPPIYLRLKKKFGINWDKGVIIAYGNVVYCKFEISPDLIVHEQTHIKQQLDYGVEKWWDRYLEDKDFRLSQELEAYKNQANYLKEKKPKGYYDRLEKICKDISSSMYGNIISYEEASNLIF